MAPGLETEIEIREKDSISNLAGQENPAFELKESNENVSDSPAEDESESDKENGNHYATIELELPKDQKKEQKEGNSKDKGDFPLGEKAEKNSLKDGKYCKRYWGLTLGILSSVILSLSNLGVKLLTHNVDPIVVCYWRFVGLLLSSGAYIAICEMTQKRSMIKEGFCPFWTRERMKCIAALLLRATAGTGSMMFFVLSMTYVSLADCTVITFSSPVFVTFLACVLMKEHCGLMNVLAAVVTFAGVVIIVRPPFLTGEAEMDTNLMTGVGLALGAMALATFVYLCLRVKSVKKLNFSLVIFAFGFFGTIYCAIYSISAGTFELLPNTGYEWILVSLIGVSTFVGQACATIASKYEEAGIISLTRTFDVVWAFIWQLLFLNVYPNAYSLIGASVIITGIVFIVLQKYLRNRPVTSPTRKKIMQLL